MKKLYRNTTKGKIAGVCYGLAYYFGIDVAFIRAAFLMFALFGWGLPAYIALWIVMPKLKTRTKR
jgi:phage shock protein PspC (stress-responsive transcriptional regulator)